MDDRDYSYFHRRLAEERAAAERSSDPVVQVVHLRLAEQYQTLLTRTMDEAAGALARDGSSVPRLIAVPPHRTL